MSVPKLTTRNALRKIAIADGHYSTGVIPKCPLKEVKLRVIKEGFEELESKRSGDGKEEDGGELQG